MCSVTKWVSVSTAVTVPALAGPHFHREVLHFTQEWLCLPLTLYPGLTEKLTRGAAMTLRGGPFLPNPRAQTPPTSLPREGQAAGKG